ncbi:MAG: ATP-binding protein [Planctomycetota bacterium]|nr:ATP-binding protein [Planctomycetota bacterium]
MDRNFVFLAFFLLLVVLIVNFLWLYQSTKSQLEVGFFKSREKALQSDVVAPLSSLIVRATAITTTFSNRVEVHALCKRSDAKERPSGEPNASALDRMLVEIQRENPKIHQLILLDQEGLVVARLSSPAVDIEHSIVERMRLAPEAEHRRLSEGLNANEVRCSLIPADDNKPLLRIEAAIPGMGTEARQAVLILEMDASEALAGVDSLKTESEPIVGQSRFIAAESGRRLYPFSGDWKSLDQRFVGQTWRDLFQGSSDISTRLGEDLVTALPIDVPQGKGWRVIGTVTQAEVSELLGSELRWTLGLAAGTFSFVILLGLGVGRLQLREVATQERASYLALSLKEKEQSERFLDSVFNAITDVIVVQDSDYNIIRSNRIAREVYGEDINGRKCYSVYRNKSEMNCKECPVDVTRLSGKAHRMEMVHPKTKEVWQINNFPLKDETGEVILVIEHARNVTEHRALESKLIQSEKLSTLGEMAAGIAHEINNPVGVVSMFAQLAAEELKEMEQTEDVLEKIQVIEEHSQQIGKIVKDLLQFARKSEGERKLVEISEIINRAMAIVELKKMASAVNIDRDSGAGVSIHADEGQISQVVLNLVVNAIHAMEGQGELTVRVQTILPGAPPPAGIAAADAGEALRMQSRVRILVKDSGPGIKASDVRKIFDPFFTTKEQGQGTGLGLSVSFGIVRDHGGMIYVDSSPGKGATFILELPTKIDGPSSPSQRLRSIEV